MFTFKKLICLYLLIFVNKSYGITYNPADSFYKHIDYIFDNVVAHDNIEKEIFNKMKFSYEETDDSKFDTMYKILNDRIGQLLKVLDVLTRRLSNSNLQEKNVDSVLICCRIPQEKLKHSVYYERLVDTNKMCITEPPGKYTVEKTIMYLGTNFYDGINEIKELIIKKLNTTYAFYANEYGIMTRYPSMHLSNEEGDCKDYDPRYTPWYRIATNTEKRVIIGIDVGIEMSGFMFSISKDTYLEVAIEMTKKIINSLSHTDYVMVFAYSSSMVKNMEVVKPDCLNPKLGRANSLNKDKIFEFLDSLNANENTGKSNHSKGLEYALQFIKKDKTSKTNVAYLQFSAFYINTYYHSDITCVMNENVVDVKIFIYMLLSDYETPFSLKKFNTELKKNNRIKAGMFFYRFVEGSISYKDFRVFTSQMIGSKIKTYLSPTYLHETTGEPMVALVKPYINSQSEFQGVVGVAMKKSLFYDFAEKLVQPQNYLMIMNEDLMVYEHKDIPIPTNTNQDYLMHVQYVEPQSNNDLMFSQMKGTTNKDTSKHEKEYHIYPGYSYYDAPITKKVDCQYNYKMFKIIDQKYFFIIATMKITSNPKHHMVVQTKERNVYLSKVPILYHKDIRMGKSYNHEHFRLCRYYHRRAISDFSAIVFMPSAFVQPSTYINTIEDKKYITENYKMLRTHIGNHHLFKHGISTSIIMTDIAEVEWIWDQRVTHTLYTVWRVIALASGVARIYPAMQHSNKYDATKYSWYRKAEAYPTSRIITPPMMDDMGAGYLVWFSKAIIVSDNKFMQTDSKGHRLLGVLGTAVGVEYMDVMLKEKFKQCNDKSVICMMMDNSGYLISHPDFTESLETGDNRYHIINIHLTMKEPLISKYLIKNKYMNVDGCYDLKKFRFHHTYFVDTKGKSIKEGDFQIEPIPNSNAYLIRKAKKTGEYIKCICDTNQHDIPIKCKVLENNEAKCQCPCHTLNNQTYMCALNDITKKIDYKVCAPIPDISSVKKDNKQYIKSDREFLRLYHDCYQQQCNDLENITACHSRAGCRWCEISYYGGSMTPKCMKQVNCFNGHYGSTGPYVEKASILNNQVISLIILTSILMIIMMGVWYCQKQRDARRKASAELLAIKERKKRQLQKMTENRRLSDDVHQIENRIVKGSSEGSIRRRTAAGPQSNNLLTGITDWHGNLVSRFTGDKKEDGVGVANNLLRVIGTSGIIHGKEQNKTVRLKSDESGESIQDSKKNRDKNRKAGGFWN